MTLTKLGAAAVLAGSLLFGGPTPGRAQGTLLPPEWGGLSMGRPVVWYNPVRIVPTDPLLRAAQIGAPPYVGVIRQWNPVTGAAPAFIPGVGFRAVFISRPPIAFRELVPAVDVATGLPVLVFVEPVPY